LVVSWPAVVIVGLSIAIAGLIVADFHRQSAIDRSLAEIVRAGGIYSRDDSVPGRPVVAIDLDSVLVDDSGRAHARGHASDRLLECVVRFTSMRELSLVGANVTDSGISNLIRLQSLRSLNLRGTRITDVGLTHLTRSDRIRRLDVRETQVTRAGVDTLARALPNAEILSDVR
jgi:hypothetical protein